MNENEIKQVFGVTLLQRRTAIKSTQQEVAEGCERTTRYYQYLEKGSYNPSLTTIFRLAEAMDTTPDKLIGEAWKVWKKAKKLNG